MNAGMVPMTTGVDPGIVPAQSTTTAGTGAQTFAEQGEAAFWAGDYQGAVYAWRHGVIDDPQNPLMVMLLGQALFATGHFDEAALATHTAMQMIPKDQWGVVVTNFRELYGRVADYTTQIRALEKAEAERPNDPALRFLAGFQYAYLGYPQAAIDQLDKGLKLAPTDEMAKQLREEMQARLQPKANAPATPAVTPRAP
jgi:Flp pilus assembly protein TadD